MRFFRRNALAIVSVWLVSQIAVLGAVPVLLAAEHHSDDEDLLCTCSALGPGHFCPMHGMAQHDESQGSDNEGNAPDCVLNAPVPASQLSLSSLLSGLAPTPARQTPFAGLTAFETVPAVVDFAISRPLRPELPPPRSDR